MAHCVRYLLLIILLAPSLASANVVIYIDYGDGSGMNLLDIARRTWHPPALAACG